MCVAALAAVSFGSGVAAAAGRSHGRVPAAKAGSCKADPGISDTEIKIGAIVSTSGAGAQVAAELDGMKARMLKANEEGELGKRKITLVNEDDAADPAKNLSAAQKLVEEEDSFAILAGSVAGDSSGQYLNEQGVPVVGWQTGLPVFGTYKNYFGMQNAQTKDPANHFTTLQADALKALGAKKVALIGYSTANAAAFVKQLSDAVKKTKGLELVYNNSDVAPGTSEFGSYAQAIKDSGADALYTGLDLIPNTQLVTALQTAGADIPVRIFPGGYDSRVLGIQGIDGAYFGLEWKPFEQMKADGAPGYPEFSKWLKQSNPNAPENQITGAGWLAANAMVEGLKAAGIECPTRKAFMTNLRKEKGYTADGWFAPVDFTEVFGHPIRCYYYVQVDSAAKTFVPQFDGKELCAKTEYKNGKATKLDKAGHAASSGS